jgi:hypothetical protein
MPPESRELRSRRRPTANWVVAFDDGGRPDDTSQACALLAEEHQPGPYVGYWTYDPEWVRDLTDYLTETYGE